MLKNVGFILRTMGAPLKCFQQGSALIMDFLISPAFITLRGQKPLVVLQPPLFLPSIMMGCLAGTWLPS